MTTKVELFGSPQTIWAPIKPSATVYEDSIVCLDQSALDEGFIVRPVAAGASNTTNKDRPFGLCVGTNRRTPIFSATYQANYITDPGVTGVRTDTTEYVMPGGPWANGEKRAMIKIAVIDPCTIIRMPIRGSAIGTALTTLTSTAGNANGLTVTTNATQFTPVANLCSIYARTGLNAGTYRVTDTTSTTVHAWDVEMQNTTATTGETYVMAPVRTNGISYVKIGNGTIASYIDGTASPATDYDIIHVLNLNLAEAGNEYVDFMFDADAFSTARA